MLLNEDQIEQWKLFRDDMLASEKFIQQRRQREVERHGAVSEMKDVLAKYLGGHIDNSEFRSIFQQKTGTEWGSFGLGGFSGAMFLNMLVNNVPDQEEVACQLRAILPVPNDAEDAYHRLTSFMDFLSDLLRQGKVAKRKIQPAHAPFFVSAWWHMQDLEEWPIYYVSGRKSLASEGAYRQLTDQPVDDYFAFREAFLFLMETLELSPWEMEHLLVWLRERKETTMPPEIPTAPSENSVIVVEDDDLGDVVENAISHTQVQLVLAKIGQKLGCNVWIARNDRGKTWNGERLGDYSLDTLPPYIVADPEAQRIIELIDVLWLRGSRGVAAAFEVEHTTSIYSGLLRMSDLVTLQPNISFPLYIVTSTARIDQVKRQLSRPTFQTLQLHENCGFFAYEDMLQEADSIMRWAKSPEAIDDLAEYVPTVLDK